MKKKFDEIIHRAKIVVIEDKMIKNEGDTIDGLADLAIQITACGNVVIIEDALVLIYSEEDDLEFFRKEINRLDDVFGDVIGKTMIFTNVGGEIEIYA